MRESENTTEISATDLNTLIKTFKIETIDILKLDIEGSEIEVLNGSKDWMSKVNNIIIELHDRFRPGCTEALLNSTKEFNFSNRFSGEKRILTKEKKTVQNKVNALI